MASYRFSLGELNCRFEPKNRKKKRTSFFLLIFFFKRAPLDELRTLSSRLNLISLVIYLVTSHGHADRWTWPPPCGDLERLAAVRDLIRRLSYVRASSETMSSDATMPSRCDVCFGIECMQCGVRSSMACLTWLIGVEPVETAKTTWN